MSGSIHDDAVLRLLALREFLHAMAETPDVAAVIRRPPTLIVRHPGHPHVDIEVGCEMPVLFAAYPALLGEPAEREAAYSAFSVALFEAVMLRWLPGSTIRLDPGTAGFVVSPERTDGRPPWFGDEQPRVRPAWKTPGPDAVVYVIDGSRVLSWESFFAVIGETVNGPQGYFGGGLDSLADCLDGGFGTSDGPFAFEWLNSALSRERLGYDEAIRLLNRRRVDREAREKLLAAQWHCGPTPFDRIVGVFDDAGIPLLLN